MFRKLLLAGTILGIGLTGFVGGMYLGVVKSEEFISIAGSDIANLHTFRIEDEKKILEDLTNLYQNLPDDCKIALKGHYESLKREFSDLENSYKKLKPFIENKNLQEVMGNIIRHKLGLDIAKFNIVYKGLLFSERSFLRKLLYCYNPKERLKANRILHSVNKALINQNKTTK
jgi:hypothetical protein